MTFVLVVIAGICVVGVLAFVLGFRRKRERARIAAGLRAATFVLEEVTDLSAIWAAGKLGGIALTLMYREGQTVVSIPGGRVASLPAGSPFDRVEPGLAETSLVKDGPWVVDRPGVEKLLRAAVSLHTSS
jgi:hypothetical protein